jgi:radical SAM protein with 4Fe4S-binding SPASM domain
VPHIQSPGTLSADERRTALRPQAVGGHAPDGDASPGARIAVAAEAGSELRVWHEQLYGCGAGYNYLFIDAEGNACPCDFAMLSFGNITTRPTGDIWRDTSDRFRAPGRACYANIISESISACDSIRRPLDPERSQAIVDRHPPFDRSRLPLFYDKFGLKPGG